MYQAEITFNLLWPSRLNLKLSAYIQLTGTFIQTEHLCPPQAPAHYCTTKHTTGAHGFHMGNKDGMSIQRCAIIDISHFTHLRQLHNESQTQRSSSQSKINSQAYTQRMQWHMRQQTSQRCYRTQPIQSRPSTLEKKRLQHCINYWPYSTWM